MNETLSHVPEGWVAVPLHGDQAAGPLTICAVVRKEAHPSQGNFALLRDTLDARVLLGCVLDVGGCVHRWVELWIQDVDRLPESTGLSGAELCNAALDERMGDLFDALREYDPSSVIQTGWERQHPPPLFIDLAAGEARSPVESESGAALSLCRDESALQQAGLPGYGGSTARYLYAPENGGEGPFVPVTSDSPRNERTAQLSAVTGWGDDLLPLNPGGGLVMVRRYAPLALGDFVALLGGERPSAGADPGAQNPPAAAGFAGDELPAGGHLFQERQGLAGKMAETFHLKVRVLVDALEAVRHVVSRLRRPLLNLTDRSFRVEMSPPSAGLPLFWTARVALVEPGQAVTVEMPESDARYFTTVGRRTGSVYHPSVMQRSAAGRGSVRIRRILKTGDGETALEGTLVTNERLDPAGNELLWVRLNLADRRVDLYGQVHAEAALAQGEVRFRTVGRRFDETVAAALDAAEGVPLDGVPFEVLSVFSTPFDLYSLGVLAVQTLLVDGGTSLPVALDETLSLAHEVAERYDETPLPERIAQIFDEDERWSRSLGPHRLRTEEVEPADAWTMVPEELWWQMLAAIVRMFPGVGPDSECADFADAPPAALHRVFDGPLEGLRKIVTLSRSLIVTDWRLNREIHCVIAGFLQQENM